MRKRKLIIATIIMVIFTMGIQTAFVSAQSLSEIRQEIREKEAALEKGKSQEKDLALQLTELEGELAKLDAAIAEGEIKLKEAQERVDTQTKNLNARLRTMYKNGNIGFLDVLLESGSISEFLTNFEMVKKIYSSDQEVLKELEAAHKEVETLQAELKESKEVTEANRATIAAKKAEIAKSNAQMQSALDALEQDAYKLIAESQGSINPDSSYAGGVMAHPSPTCRIITSSYGNRTAPYVGFHTGIDLAKYGSAHGEPIVAANDGRVILASWYGGYGNCIMIDHGGGVVTLYGHASKLHVSKGQYVARGQHIGNIGNTGNSFGAHLHFEVQINGRHQNPYSYIY